MDANKLKVLKSIGYEVKRTCANCVHGSFSSVNSDWGTCMVNQYQHEKHTGPERDLSINKYGKCAVEGEGGYEKNVSAYERLGKFAELVEVE